MLLQGKQSRVIIVKRHIFSVQFTDASAECVTLPAAAISTSTVQNFVKSGHTPAQDRARLNSVVGT